MNTLGNGTENCLDMEFTDNLRAGQFQDVVCRCLMTSRSVLPWETTNTCKWQTWNKAPISKRQGNFWRISHYFRYSLAGTAGTKGKTCVEVMKVTISHLWVRLSWLHGWEDLNWKKDNSVSHLVFRTNWWRVVVMVVKNDWPSHSMIDEK